MANLTLAIDDELLQKAKQQAVKERTSVNALIRNYLSRYVDSCSRRLAALSAFETVASTVESAVRPTGVVIPCMSATEPCGCSSTPICGSIASINENPISVNTWSGG